MKEIPTISTSALCSRADLLRAMATGNVDAVAAVAHFLDLEREEETLQPVEKNKTVQRDRGERLPVNLASAVRSDIPLQDIPFWRVEQHLFFKSEKRRQDQPATAGLNHADWAGRPVTPPSFQPLTSWNILRRQLRNHCAVQHNSRKIDISKVVRQLSRGEMVSSFPRLQRHKWGERFQIIIDRSERLVPYWQDQLQVLAQLELLFPRHGVEVCCYWQGFSEPVILDDVKGDRPYQLPPANTLVLVLGDLGTLAHGGFRERELWLNQGRKLHGAGCRPVALLPSLNVEQAEILRKYWQMFSWEEKKSYQPQEKTTQAMINRILTCLSSCSRIEPGLLRAVRRLLGADAGSESLVWQHSSIISPSCVAATLNPASVRSKLPLFERETAAVRDRILSLQREWRANLSKEVWFEEVINLPNDSQTLPSVQQDLEEAILFFVNLGQELVAGGHPSGVVPWLLGLQQRLTDDTWKNPAISKSLQQLWHYVNKDNPTAMPPPGYDPANIPPDGDQSVRTLKLLQQGSRLVLEPVGERQMAGERASLLGTIRSRNGQVVMEPLVAEDANAFWQEGKPPCWATGWGRDRFGLFAEFTVYREGEPDIVQRMRWLTSGSFMMGSAEDESERYSDEGPQHKVTISRGFWLWDTVCSQEMWQAVMGQNPSRFKGRRRPVEQVSWEEANEFIEWLNQLQPGLDLTLPSEAQWEYSCRAETMTPFSFGDTISSEQVNYNGNYPYRGGKKGEYRQETVEVATLPANPWGLYEMHGNVWEWCLDQQRDYRGRGESDPLGSLQGGGSRVVRGGSWNLGAGGVRSACRFAIGPGIRHDFLGFRCARVQKQGQELAEPAGGQGQQRDEFVDPQPAGLMVRLDGQGKAKNCPWPANKVDILIRSDMEQLTLACLSKPAWADEIGRDSFGLWAAFSVHPAQGRPVSQRMRWIVPGRLLMGSPNDESERFDSESPQHEVIISRGFWLAETACTQVLWQAVLADKPSRFKGNNRPVEQISWDDIQEFFKKVNAGKPGLDLTLPTEAQWEYSCRAGTMSPFSFGANISPEQVNYDGNYPYQGGGEGQYRRETVPVATLPPNPWGLYEMHGNVDEWCLDGQREYKDQVEVDPVGPLQEGGSRVVRGGSWSLGARGVRSAYRYASVPGFRRDFLGFRCARVQKQKEKQAEPGSSQAR